MTAVWKIEPKPAAPAEKPGMSSDSDAYDIEAFLNATGASCDIAMEYLQALLKYCTWRSTGT